MSKANDCEYSGRVVLEKSMILDVQFAGAVLVRRPSVKRPPLPGEMACGIVGTDERGRRPQVWAEYVEGNEESKSRTDVNRT